MRRFHSRQARTERPAAKPASLAIDCPTNNKLNRDCPRFAGGWLRLAWRSQGHVEKAWQAERYAELNQIAWNTTPVCGNVRAGSNVFGRGRH